MRDTDWFRPILTDLIAGRALTAEQTRTALGEMIAGRAEEWQTASFLTALRLKGETAEEIAAAANVLREHMIRLPTSGAPVLDTCGTGGDGSGTFNISTAVALVVAGCGVPVVKHGNRSVSSRSGSADVLLELGVPIDKGVEWAGRCLQEMGFAFCFAPHFHPAMANVGPIRRKLGVRTLFNLLGPLANPAGAAYQLLGVGEATLLTPLAGAVAQLGIARAVLVSAHDGMDEVSLAAPTRVLEVCDGAICELEWTPANFGLEPCSIAELKADGPQASARIVQDVLRGQTGPARRIVLANTAAALYAAGVVTEVRDGVPRAEEAIDTGRALAILENLIG